MGCSHAVLQAGHGIVAACIADDEARAAVVVRASGQGCCISSSHLRGGRIGDALDLPVGGGNAGGRAVLVGASIQRCARVGRSSYLSAGLNSTSTGQRERADGRLGGDAGLEPLAENLGQGIHDALAFGGESGRAVLALGQVADLRIATGQRDVLAQDDLIGINIAGHRHPRLAVVEVGGLLVGRVANGGRDHEDIALLDGHVGVRLEIRGDNRIIGCRQVFLRACIHRAADASRNGIQLFDGRIVAQVNGGIIQTDDFLTDLSVNVVVPGGSIHHQIQHIILRLIVGRNLLNFLEACMSRLCNGGGDGTVDCLGRHAVCCIHLSVNNGLQSSREVSFRNFALLGEGAKLGCQRVLRQLLLHSLRLRLQLSEGYKLTCGYGHLHTSKIIFHSSFSAAMTN